MKKSLLVVFALTFTAGTAWAQASREMAQGTPTVVVDTAHYFFNKQYFKTGVALTSTAFPFYGSSHATTTLVGSGATVSIRRPIVGASVILVVAAPLAAEARPNVASTRVC